MNHITGKTYWHVCVCSCLKHKRGIFCFCEDWMYWCTCAFPSMPIWDGCSIFSSLTNQELRTEYTSKIILVTLTYFLTFTVHPHVSVRKDKLLPESYYLLSKTFDITIFILNCDLTANTTVVWVFLTWNVQCRNLIWKLAKLDIILQTSNH